MSTDVPRADYRPVIPTLLSMACSYFVVERAGSLDRDELPALVAALSPGERVEAWKAFLAYLSTRIDIPMAEVTNGVTNGTSTAGSPFGEDPANPADRRG